MSTEPTGLERIIERLAHCLTLAGHLRAIVGRFTREGAMNPSALLHDDPQDRVLELARVEAVAEALEALAQDTTP